MFTYFILEPVITEKPFHLFGRRMTIIIEQDKPRWYFGYYTPQAILGLRRHSDCLKEGYATRREAEKAMAAAS